MKSTSALFGSLVASILATIAILAPFPAQSLEETFQFAVPPGDIVYRVNKKTGELTACVFATTTCFPPGLNSGPQTPGDYELIAKRIGEVIRLDQESGNQGICKLVQGTPCCCPGAQRCNAQAQCP